MLQGPLAPREAAELIETVARAVHYAHERGIVHRDLKPANILLQTAPDSATHHDSAPAARGLCAVPKITDFGLAKDLEREDSHTRTDTVVGTPHYMAPEQATGKGENIGPGTDIYALGAILYELLAGKPPFEADSPFNVLLRVTREEAEPIRRRRPNTPRDLEIICLKCLHKQPHRRYGSAAELADDLRRFLNYEPIRARPASTRERLVQWVRRHPAWAGLAAGLVIAAVALGCVTVSNLREAQRRRDAARDHAYDLLDKARGANAAGQYDQALAHLHQLAPLLNEAGVPEQVRASADILTREVEGRVEARELLKQFEVLHDESLFYAAPGNYLVAARKAQAALSLIGFTADAWQPSESFTEEQAGALKRGCLELFLVLAESEDPYGSDKQTDKALSALAWLDRAEKLRLRDYRAFHLRRALYLERAGKSKEAEEEQDLAKACAVASAFDRSLIGREEFLRNNVKEALAWFTAAVEGDKPDFWVWYYKALCYVRLNQLELADESLTAALSLKKMVWPYLLRGFVRGQLQLFQQGESDLSAAEKLLNEQREVREGNEDRKEDVDARYVLLNNRAVMTLGRVAQMRNAKRWTEVECQEKFEEALADLRAATKLKSDQYQAFVTAGQAFGERHDPSTALNNIDAAIKKVEKQGNTDIATLALLYRIRARWEEEAKRLPEALASLQQAADLFDPMSGAAERAKFLAEIGHVNARNRRFAEAIAAYDEALKLNDCLIEALKVRAECLLKLERWKEAEEAFDKVIGSTNAPSAKQFAGRALARMKRMDKPDREGAVADLTLALALAREPAKESYWLQRGQLYLALEQYPAALDDFKKALDRKRGAAALLGRATVQARLGRQALAIADVDEALRQKDLTPNQRYAAAAVFALAAGAFDEPPGRTLTKSESDTRLEYQDRAIEQVRLSLLALPPEQRVEFWKSHPARDRALAPLRSTPGFTKLRREFAPQEAAAK
jgi:tetratricopeptide (TPR) repeat protein